MPTEQAKEERKRLKRATHKTTALALFTLFAVLVMAWRTEHQATSLEKTNYELRLTQYHSCLAGEAIIEQFNKQQTALANAEEAQTTDPSLAAMRISIYTNGLLPSRTCSAPPK